LAADLTDHDRLGLQIIQRHVVAELQPMIQALQAAMAADPVVTTPPSLSELVDQLAVTEVNHQRTLTAVGIVRELQRRDPSLADVTVVTSSEPHNVVVTNPLDTRAEQYWQERRLAGETAHEAITLPELIELRSQSLLYALEAVQTERRQQLDNAIEQLRILQSERDQRHGQTRSLENEQAERDGRLSELETLIVTAERRVENLDNATVAYTDVIAWVEEQLAELDADMTEAEFHLFTSRLHFARGEHAAVFNLLNSLETVKRDNPLLFMRMLGVAPSRDGSPAGQRSDLYGTVFDYAIHRSQDIARSAVSPGYQVFRDRIEGLTQLRREQVPLLYINDAQLAQLETYLAQLRADMVAASSGSARVVSAVASILFDSYRRSGELRRMLDATRREQREALVEFFATAEPKAFMHKFIDSDFDIHDADIAHVIAKRLSLDTAPFTLAVHMEEVGHGKETIDILREEPMPQAIHLYWLINKASRQRADQESGFTVKAVPHAMSLAELRLRLWETMPDPGAVLDDAFFDDLAEMANHQAEIRALDTAVSRQEQHSHQASRERELLEKNSAVTERAVSRVQAIAVATRTVSKTAWLHWAKQQRERRGEVTPSGHSGVRRRLRQARHILKLPVAEVFRRALTGVPLDAVVASGSALYCLDPEYIEQYKFDAAPRAWDKAKVHAHYMAVLFRLAPESGERFIGSGQALDAVTFHYTDPATFLSELTPKDQQMFLRQWCQRFFMHEHFLPRKQPTTGTTEYRARIQYVLEQTRRLVPDAQFLNELTEVMADPSLAQTKYRAVLNHLNNRSEIAPNVYLSGTTR
jgi:hypothetical protein